MHFYKDVCPYAENTTFPKVYKLEIYTISEPLWEQRSFKLTSNSQLCTYPQNLLGVVYLTLKLGKWLCFYSLQLRWKSRLLLYAISSTALTFHTSSSNNLKPLKQKTFLTEKHQNKMVSFWMPVASCCFSCFFCCSVCLFVYGAFCHNALKLDMSTLFTTFFPWILKFILF